MSDPRELREYNRKVMADIMKNNSRAEFEKRGNRRLHVAKDIGNEALEYIQRKGTGTHESNHKYIDEVLGYYKPDWTEARGSRGRTMKEQELSKKEQNKKLKEANEFFCKLLGIR